MTMTDKFKFYCLCYNNNIKQISLKFFINVKQLKINVVLLRQCIINRNVKILMKIFKYVHTGFDISLKFYLLKIALKQDVQQVQLITQSMPKYYTE